MGEFLRNNWFWILLIVLFLWMHRRGGGCGAHGQHGGGGHGKPEAHPGEHGGHGTPPQGVPPDGQEPSGHGSHGKDGRRG